MCCPGSSGIFHTYLKEYDCKRKEKYQVSDHVQNCPSLWREAIINDINGYVSMVEEGISSQDHEVEAEEEGDDLICPDMR